MAKLAHLELLGIALTDRGADHLARLPSLQWLTLDGERLRLGEAGLANLGQLANLTDVGVYIPNGLVALSPVQTQRTFPNARIYYGPASPTTWPTTAPAPLP